MKEFAILFKEFGLTDENSIRQALATFSDEYNRLTESKVRNAIFSDVKEFDNPLSKGLIEILIKLLAGSQLGAVAPGRVMKGMFGRLTQGTNSILDKISQMMQANGPEAFNKVNDYARIAAHVYGNRKDTILPREWKCLGNSYQGQQLDDKKSGLQAALYKKIGHYPKYVYAIAGTRGMDIKDWKANLGQVAGISDQYDRAGEISEKLAKQLGSEYITMVGHSKGGGQAAYCALRTGSPAITFNPAGLGLYKFNHDRSKMPDISSYVMVFDPLNMMQMLAQLVYADLTADGSVHYLKCAESTQFKEWHGIDGFLRLGGMKDIHQFKKKE